jgi:hypothetical protein
MVQYILMQLSIAEQKRRKLSLASLLFIVVIPCIFILVMLVGSVRALMVYVVVMMVLGSLGQRGVLPADSDGNLRRNATCDGATPSRR